MLSPKINSTCTPHNARLSAITHGGDYEPYVCLHNYTFHFKLKPMIDLWPNTSVFLKKSVLLFQSSCRQFEEGKIEAK
jgi:hypothetical protein